MSSQSLVAITPPSLNYRDTYVISLFFLFHFDHQRYEAHSYEKERFQVQEIVSGFNAWAWDCSFDTDEHWHH